MRLLLTIALVALALALVPVTPAGALAVGFLAYRCGTDVRAEQALLTALAIAGGLGVLYTLAKGIWPSLP